MTRNQRSPLDSVALRRAFAHFPAPVTTVCAMVDGAPAGITVSSFTSVSLDPPLVSVCVGHSSTTWPLLQGLDLLGVSVLAEDHAPIAAALSARSEDRFAGVAWEASAGGAVFIDGSPLQLECHFERAVPAGDHDIVLLEVVDYRCLPDIEPMVFHRSAYRNLDALT